MIIEGKRVGNKLGIPTANINIDLDNIRKLQMIPGIYLGHCNIKKITNKKLEHYLNQKFPAIVSFGFNPQYN